MTIVLLTQKKGEKPIRTEYDDSDQLDAMNKASLMKFDDNSIFVVIFGKDSETDKMFIKLEKKS